MKRIIVISLTLAFLAAATNCAGVRIAKEGTGSLVAISASSAGLGASGVGIEVSLLNTTTAAVYHSVSLGKFSKHSIVQNLPAGDYNVVQVAVPVGGVTFRNNSRELRDYFGLIRVAPDSKYYLGNFRGKRGIGTKNILTIELIDPDVPAKLIEAVRNQQTGWSEGDFINSAPPNKEPFMVF